MTPQIILNAAADLIARPFAWTQRALARDAKGRPTRDVQAATSWCPQGAIMHVGHEHPEARDQALALLFAQFPETHPDQELNAISQWNDAHGRTQSEVVAKLRQAGATANQSQQSDGGEA